MQARLLEWLACPRCAASFPPSPASRPMSDEVVDGELICEQGHRFPIRRGIPRLVLERSRTRTTARRQAAFGYGRSHFPDSQVPNFRTAIMPEPEAWFYGKLGLDAGCGAGSHLLAAVQAGAEMIGVDYTDAVDAAQAKVAAMPGAHVVQADLRTLPFRKGSFDFLYSWGILHHLPDPEVAFCRLLPYLKPGGLVVVGLYQVTLRKRLLELPRLVTTHLPLPVARAAAWGAAVLDYYGVIVPYRWLMSLFGSRLTQVTPSHIREYARYPFRVSETDWFDRFTAPITHWYRRDEVLAWFQRSRLVEIRVEPIGDFWWRGQARVPC